MKSILIFCSVLLLVGCGLKSIPYSQSTDGNKPNAAAQSHYNWGLAYAKEGNLAQAITEFKLAIQKEPGWAIPYFNLGAVYGNMGELEQAIVAWERATQLDVDFAKAYYNLAVAYSLKAEDALDDSSYVAHIEKSIASLREAIRVDKDVISKAKTEPAFDKLRKLPEYKTLVETSELKR